MARCASLTSASSHGSSGCVSARERKPPRRRFSWPSTVSGPTATISARALRPRRDQLDEVLDGQDVLLPARRLADDGLKAWRQVVERGDEGLVAKDPASPYRGGRTRAWLKVKVPRYRDGERGCEAKPSDRR